METDLELRAVHAVKKIRENFPDQPDWRFITGIAEEAGEVIGAYNRWSGTSRRVGTVEQLAEEMADVIYTVYMAAEVLGIDLPRALDEKWGVITSRGWKQR